MGNNKTGCRKHIWKVTFRYPDKDRHTNVAAHNLKEVLEFFNEEGQLKIVEIIKTEEEIQYHY